MRIRLRDVLPLIALAAVSARSLELDQIASNSGAIPSPQVIPPSEYCKFIVCLYYRRLGSNEIIGDGDNGQWSSFALRVGTPAQDVRVLVSTNSPATLVVEPVGCTTRVVNPVPNNCANARGGLFNPNSSSTWLDQSIYGINEDGIGFEANLGYSQNADYGLETLGLGFTAGSGGEPTLKNQTVAAIATASPFYLYEQKSMNTPNAQY